MGSKSSAQAFLLLDGQIYPLDREIVSVGRALSNKLVIQRGSVSRQHAMLVEKGGRYTIIDQGSTGGTFVNGRRVRIWELRSGDVIALADYLMVFVDGSPGPTGRILQGTQPFDETTS